ncbi:MAG: hypothetical protein IKF52_06445 [Clostridia bacterium]|nr:hypothetical protein [Clostridia bacterium]
MRIYYLSHAPEGKKYRDGYYIIGNIIFDIVDKRVNSSYIVVGETPEEKIEYLKKYEDADINYEEVFYYDDSGEYDVRVVERTQILTNMSYRRLIKEDLDLL